MNIVKYMGRFFGGFCVVTAASALIGCTAETTGEEGEQAGQSEEAFGNKNPSYVYVRVGTLAHRRVSLPNGVVSVSQNAALSYGNMIADFGRLTPPSKASDLSDNLALWKLSGRLGVSSRWANLATATADVKAILAALDNASAKGCAGDWHVATFQTDGNDGLSPTCPRATGRAPRP